jgi:hypothetical protein
VNFFNFNSFTIDFNECTKNTPTIDTTFDFNLILGVWHSQPQWAGGMATLFS